MGYPNWIFIKSGNMHWKEGQMPTREKQDDKRNNKVIPYVTGLRTNFLETRHPSVLLTLLHPQTKN